MTYSPGMAPMLRAPSAAEHHPIPPSRASPSAEPATKLTRCGPTDIKRSAGCPHATALQPGASVERGDDIAACACRLEQQLQAADQENQRLHSSNERLTVELAAITRQQIETRHLAHHDGLTGLPNRQMLMQRLQAGIAESFSRQGQLALMFIDLDGFKVVNDRYGHSAGDKLLTVVASRIASCVRAEDVACRYGGDEFVVMLADINEAAIAVGIAETIRSRIEGLYSINGQELRISASIGLALYPSDGDQWDALLNCADASMYRDKIHRQGRHRPSLAALDQEASRSLSGDNGQTRQQRLGYVRYQTDASGMPL